MPLLFIISILLGEEEANIILQFIIIAFRHLIKISFLRKIWLMIRYFNTMSFHVQAKKPPEKFESIRRPFALFPHIYILLSCRNGYFVKD
jgi:hypothetical protein